jgi:hypothetical protein
MILRYLLPRVISCPMISEIRAKGLTVKVKLLLLKLPRTHFSNGVVMSCQRCEVMTSSKQSRALSYLGLVYRRPGTTRASRGMNRFHGTMPVIRGMARSNMALARITAKVISIVDSRLAIISPIHVLYIAKS